MIEPKILDKFDAEFYTPRLICSYCQKPIETGQVRFLRDANLHRTCMKKARKGVMP